MNEAPCRSCGTIVPFTTEHFAAYNNRTGRGLRHVCHGCHLAGARRRYAARRQEISAYRKRLKARNGGYRVPLTPDERFWRRVELDGPVPVGHAELGSCWLWLGARQPRTGHGRFSVKGKPYPAHRFAYETIYGPMCGQLMACHRCDNAPCVRPDHIYPGTDTENARDRIAAGRQPTGEGNAAAKLTAAIVLAARRRVGAGERVTALAREYGVAQSVMSNAVRGVTWSHVIAEAS